MNPYRKLSAGSPVTAFSLTAYNRMIDMLNWWQSNQAHSGGGPLRNLVDWDQTVFKTKNSSGAVVPSYGVLGLSGPLFGPTDNLTEFQNVTPLEGVAPVVADHAGKWGVALEMIDDGRIGRCCFAGVVPTRVYVNGAADAYCDVDAGHADGDYTCYLGTGASGAQILWRENEGSGAETVVWAIVRLGKTTGPIPFMLKESLVPGGTADAYPTDSAGEIIDEGLTIEVTDTVGDKRARGKDDTGTTGALGLAEVLGDGTAAIVELEPMLLWILAQASDVVGPEDDIALKNHVPLQPVGGGLVAYPSTATNLYGQTFGVGDYVLVLWNESAVDWIGFKAGSGGDSLILIELKTDLAPGGTADAYALTWDEEGPCYAAVLESYFTVYDDPLRHHRGRGRDGMGGADGSWGVIRYSPLSGRLEIVNLRQQAKLCRGKLYGVLTATTASQYVDNIVPLDGGLNPVNSTGDGVQVTAYNVYKTKGFAGPDDGVCYIVWNEVDDRWEFIDVECP